MNFREVPQSFVERIEADPWIAFGVSRAATRAEITAAFRRLVRAYHPDRSAPFLRETNAGILRALYAARERLLSAASP